ncbi:MAG: signal peptide peptidase SppA [Planctomycetota bacterium]|jgi:protease-4
MKDFLKTTLASVIGLLIAIGILFTILSTYWVVDLPPDIPESCVLVIDETLITSEAGHAPSLLGWATDQEVASLPLRKAIAGIEAAAEDGRIRAILLWNGPQLHGLTASRALQDALQDFRDAGKPVYAYAPDFARSNYYLASVADPIVMPPLGIFDMTGFAAEMQFYTEAMEKLGVEMQVTRVGKYKSAVEPYILEQASPANRQQIQDLLEDVHDTYLSDLGEAQGVEVSSLRALVDRGGMYSADQALEFGLIDQVAYFDELLVELQDLVGDGEEDQAFAQVGFHRYLSEMERVEDSFYGSLIMVVYAEGEIVDGYTEDGIGGDQLGETLRLLRLDPDIDGVVLRVNSPGGSATASEVILREMQLLREAGKSVVASMGPVAASGGYWISCQADRILAQPNTITGSIGVFGMFPNIEGLMEEIGINVDVVKTGPFADLTSIYHRKSEEELALFQGYVDTIYDGFLDRVVAGRGLERVVVQEIAQGRVWSGTRALELGLVDELGDLEDAIQACADLIGTDDWHVDHWEYEADGLDALLEGMMAPEDYPVTRIDLPAPLRDVWADWRRIQSYVENPGVYARMPFDIRVR